MKYILIDNRLCGEDGTIIELDLETLKILL